MDDVVVPLTADAAVTLLLEPECFAERFGLELVEGFLAFPEALEPLTRALEDGVDPAWFAHLIVDAPAGEVVGLGGFTGPPNDGVVEIGYGVAPSRQRRGFATAAVRAWVARAGEGGVALVCAHTLGPGENASTAVLRRCGFARVGELFVTEDGPTQRWELLVSLEWPSNGT